MARANCLHSPRLKGVGELNDEIVMYIVLNTDLKMSRGKQIASACHACLKAYETALRFDNTSKMAHEWHNASHTKIVLKASNAEILNLINKYIEGVTPFISAKIQEFVANFIIDEGRTQVEPGSITSLAFSPMPKSKCPAEIAKLKLV